MQINEPAEYALLGLLQHQPMHGYELFQQFEHSALGQIVRVEMSQMYAFLKKLERLEFIEAEFELQGARPLRKVFHLTTLGRETLFQWLTEPVVRPREIRILFLIKLYFVQRFLPRETSPLIERQIVACRNFLAHLEAQHAPSGESGEEVFFDHVVLRSRIYQTRSLLDWLDELQREMAGIP
jgi:PadR family transcriptional regulator, regulatory protein AphA